MSNRSKSVTLRVPSDAVAVVRVHWAAIRGDRVLQRFAPISEIFALSKELEIPSTATESIVVFSTTFGSSTSGDTAILLTPGVAQQSIRAVSDRGWSSESLDGVTIYRNPLSGIGAVALSHDVLAIGYHICVFSAHRARGCQRSGRGLQVGAPPRSAGVAWDHFIVGLYGALFGYPYLQRRYTPIC